jgi:hypothetical protein
MNPHRYIAVVDVESNEDELQYKARQESDGPFSNK